MRLIDVLKKYFYIDLEVNYEKILDTLLEDISNNEIIGYEIDETDSANILIKIATADGNVKEIRCSTTYDNNSVLSTSISDKNTQITISYNPFNIKAFSNFEDYDKSINIKKTKHIVHLVNNNIIDLNENNKIKLEINISNKYTNAKDTIDNQIVYTTDSNNIERIIYLIKSTTDFIKENEKQKALKK